jgi:4-hydroxy-tetrahydrodipicolinate synthase
MKKETNKFGTILLPFITPYNEKEEVNYAAYEELIHYAVKRNFVDTIVVTGSTGEFFSLTFDERVKLFETAVKASRGRKPVIAGTGCASTRETVALTNAAVSLGIQTCMIVAPFYCKPSQEAVYNHYMRVIDETKADLLLYNIPIFTGINIEPAILKKLAQNKRVIGVKDESGVNPIQMTDYYLITRDVNPDFLIFNGDDIMAMPALAQGSDGIVSGGSQIYGDLFRKVFELFYEGKNIEAIAAYRSIVRLTEMLFINGRVNPVPVLRAAIEMVTGIKVGTARGPLNALTEAEKAATRETLVELNILK